MAPPSQPLPADDVFRDRSLLPLPAAYRKLGPTLEGETGQAHRVGESLVAISAVQQKQISGASAQSVERARVRAAGRWRANHGALGNNS
jgi:hypothetical protein